MGCTTPEGPCFTPGGSEQHPGGQRRTGCVTKGPSHLLSKYRRIVVHGTGAQQLVSAAALCLALFALFLFSICLLCLLIMQTHNMSAADPWLCGFRGGHGFLLGAPPSYWLPPVARRRLFQKSKLTESPVARCRGASHSRQE